MENRFYICRHCGNLVGMVNDAGVPIVCCGEEMEALVPNTSDGAVEKHLPVVTVEGDKVSVVVGETKHPMTDAHYIEWVYLQTERGGHRIGFKPGEEPKAVFCTLGEKPLAVYAYCNLHGLWVTEIK